MKTFNDILKKSNLIEKKEKGFTLDQINTALLKIGIGPKTITLAMNALNVLRGLGIVEAKSNGQ